MNNRIGVTVAAAMIGLGALATGMAGPASASPAPTAQIDYAVGYGDGQIILQVHPYITSPPLLRVLCQDAATVYARDLRLTVMRNHDTSGMVTFSQPDYLAGCHSAVGVS